MGVPVPQCACDGDKKKKKNSEDYFSSRMCRCDFFEFCFDPLHGFSKSRFFLAAGKFCILANTNIVPCYF